MLLFKIEISDVVRFDIANSKVTYRSTFMKSEDYKKNHSKGRIVVGLFGTSSIPDPCENVFYRRVDLCILWFLYF